MEEERQKDAYEYLKDSFFSCIDTQSPKMFVVVGPGGRGKTKMCRNVVSKLHKNEQINAKYIVLDLKNIETIESEYASLFISAIIITEIYQYILNDLEKKEDEKLEKFEKKAIELLQLWNIFSEVENLNKKITLKESKDGLVKGIAKMVLSFGETCATSIVAIQNPFVAAAYSVGVEKAKDLVEGLVEKIKLKDDDEEKLEDHYHDFF